MNNIDNKNYEKYMKEVFMNTLWDMKEEKNFKDCGDRLYYLGIPHFTYV